MIWKKLGLGKNRKFMENSACDTCVASGLLINRQITNNFACSHVRNYELFDGLRNNRHSNSSIGQLYQFQFVQFPPFPNFQYYHHLEHWDVEEFEHF